MLERFPVIPGAESFFLKGNQIGILISHGFNGTPQSVRFLGEYMASKGFTVYAPRLKGHGTHCTDMERCTYNDWIQSLEEGYQYLKQHCRDIFIIGQSMGGTLTLNLAEKNFDIRGIVLINAAIKNIPELEKCLTEQRFIEEGPPDIKAAGVQEITYEKVPVSSIRELLTVMRVTRQNLSKVVCPALLFQSVDDHVVPPENADYIAAHIRSRFKKVISLFDSYHVASLDNEKEWIAEQCCLFIQQIVHKKSITEIS
ncbi:carboxylesterase [Weizmannia acidilactici]|uniref:Carboxylesterase n=1 Tax=Weizmannia acidilactici TaxID=2607726 RepID=A0A5J4JFT4_9BACI|nr:alpha/beta fold hydrolase [Weizmannia acidilactici]GER68312.1 carboxylesterase [Weizmannia acidilactici]GER70983.1 carboxylesterase [Weizmannia acidilactici]GER74601.1 carboxylesterase [Weizmannia acidilactici]